jgi:hypothetical protein
VTLYFIEPRKNKPSKLLCLPYESRILPRWALVGIRQVGMIFIAPQRPERLPSQQRGAYRLQVGRQASKEAKLLEDDCVEAWHIVLLSES